jgi:hypothetical protein
MVLFSSLLRAKSSWCIVQVVAKHASGFVVFYKRVKGIVLVIGWCAHWLHQFEGDMPY